MFPRFLSSASRHGSFKKICDSRLMFIRSMKMTILGAMSSVGQPLSILLQQLNVFSEIAIHDEFESTQGLALELKCLDSSSTITCHHGFDGIKNALAQTKIVVMAGGTPYSGDSTSMKEHLFLENCKFVYDSSKACSMWCSDAIICVVTTPVCCTLPIVFEIFNKKHLNSNSKIIGINNVQKMRANNLLAQYMNLNPHFTNVPLIGGCTESTAVPAMSYSMPVMKLPLIATIEITRLFKRQKEDNLSKREPHKKNFHPLAMAYGSCEFVKNLFLSMTTAKHIVDNAFVANTKNKSIAVPYFSGPIVLGENGVVDALPLPQNITSYEKNLIQETIPLIEKEINAGLAVFKSLSQNDNETETNAQLSPQE